MKSKTTALILAIFVGGLGIDRFYLGYAGMGILKLLTGGCFGILWIIDIINIATGSLAPADGSGYADAVATPPVPASPVPASAAVNPFEELEKASKLHEQGILSDDEYNKLKTDLLGKM